MQNVMDAPETLAHLAAPAPARTPEAASRLVQISVLHEVPQVQQKVLNLRRFDHVTMRRLLEEGFDLYDQADTVAGWFTGGSHLLHLTSDPKHPLSSSVGDASG